MKKSSSSTPKETQEIEQLSHAELVLMVLGLQKIIATLTEKLAIAQRKTTTKILLLFILNSSPLTLKLR